MLVCEFSLRALINSVISPTYSWIERLPLRGARPMVGSSSVLRRFRKVAVFSLLGIGFVGVLLDSGVIREPPIPWP